MNEQRFDVLILGAGPAGEGAAVVLAQAARSVAVVERACQVGGRCHHGALPARTLRHIIRRHADFVRGPFGHGCPTTPACLGALKAAAKAAIHHQINQRKGFYDRSHAAVLEGEARFLDAHTVALTRPGGGVDRLSAAQVVVAVGSRPAHPPWLDFSHPAVRDPDTLLALESTPRRLLIYGGGVEACEFACLFSALGAEVTLVTPHRRLLMSPALDVEVVDALAFHLKNAGVQLRHEESLVQVAPREGGCDVTFAGGERLSAEVLLYAEGRVGDTEGLNLAVAGVTPSEHGFLSVDQDFRTSVPHLFAVGDVLGQGTLASVAFEQGRQAAQVLLGSPRATTPIPIGLYTNPEVASVGATEEGLREAGVPFEVGRALFRTLAHAQITGQTTGLLKVLFHRETRALLGVHCFGEQATELVHVGMALCAPPARSVDFLAQSAFTHPSLAEAFRVAALDGLSRLR